MRNRFNIPVYGYNIPAPKNGNYKDYIYRNYYNLIKCIILGRIINYNIKFGIKITIKYI